MTETKAMQIRIPAEMKEWLERQSSISGMSQNAQVIDTLRLAMKCENKLLIDPISGNLVTFGGEISAEVMVKTAEYLGYEVTPIKPSKPSHLNLVSENETSSDQDPH